jgi:beta-glucosidase
MNEAAGVPCSSINATKPNGNGNINDNTHADTADNDYEQYSETVAEVQHFGFGAYRMSISWTRVLSYDTSSSAGTMPTATVNQQGIEHYRGVLQSFKDAGVDVAVTMWHWDTPQALENWAYSNPDCMVLGQQTGSFWLCKQAPEAFQLYAETILTEFDGMVKWWITLNEPLTVASNGYSGSGSHAPGRCGDRSACWDGDDATEPFTAVHNMLRCHAAAFWAWRELQNRHPSGSVCGVTLNGDYALPVDPNDPEDVAASHRSMEYQMAIFADPIFHGKWPDSVVAGVGNGLPALDTSIHNSHAGIYFQNTYTTKYTWHGAKDSMHEQSVSTAGFYGTGNFSESGYHPVTGEPVGTPSSNGWLFSYGPGIALLQTWLHNRYPQASGFVVTENGWGNATQTEEEDVNDLVRCEFYRSYIGHMSENAVKRGIPVVGYFAWSIMDNYEWADGFTTRFGLTYVDYATQQRTPKLSMRWFSAVTQLKSLPAGGMDALPACESFLNELSVV